MTKDDKFKQLLTQKESPLLSFDFEERMMTQIHEKVAENGTKRHYLRLMYLFFGIGLLFGSFISISLTNKHINVSNWEFDSLRYLLLIPVALILLFVFEKIYRIKLFKKGEEGIFDI